MGRVTRRGALGGMAALAAIRPAGAAGGALYQATAIVTGSDERERPAGIRRCFEEVLRKLTGDPEVATRPGVPAILQDAASFVRSFAYVDPRAGLLHHDDQGTYDRSYELTVRFDPARVDPALAAAGLRIWAETRPLLLPVVLVRDREPTPFLLSAESGRGAAMRGALGRAAAELGMGVRWPTERALAAWGVGLIGFPAPLGAEPDGAVPDGAGPDGAVRVVGTLSWSVRAMGWVGAWRAEWGGAEREWGVSGVGFDAALATLARGAAMLAAGTGVP